MATQELTTEQALQLLESGGAMPQPAPTVDIPMEPVVSSSPSLLNFQSPYQRALGVGAGGLLNLGDALSFGLAGNLAAGGSAVYGDLKSFFTGQPSNTSFDLERQKLAELKALARQEQTAQGFVVPESVPLIGGAPLVEVAGALKAPIPKAVTISRGEKLLPALARAVPAATVLGAVPAASVEVSVDQMIDQAMLGGGISGTAAGLFPTIGGVARATGSAAEKSGKALMRTSLGARVSDYVSKAKNSLVELPDGLSETQVKRSLDNVISKKILGNTTDPALALARLQNAQDEIEGQIQTELRKVDKSGTKIEMPSFSNALKYINDNKVDLTDVDSYSGIIEEFKKAVKNETKFVEPSLPTLYDEFGNAIPKEQMTGMRQALEKWMKKNAVSSKLSLDTLNKQRKIVGEKYKNSPQSDPGFWRAFYKDLKEHVEKYAPEVKNLNKQKQDLVVVQPILERTMRQAEGQSAVSNAMRQLYTTGGAGLAGGAILGGLAGEPEAGVIGALGLRGLATPKGQQLTGRALMRLSSALENVGAPGGLLASLPTTATRGSSLLPLLMRLQSQTQPEIMSMAAPITAPTQELTTEQALALIQ